MLYRPIAVFDSGLGSLSVVRQLRRVLPYENILYFADKMNFPYGEKTKNELKQIMIKSIRFLEKYQPKLIVLASNTPSVQLYNEIRNIGSVDLIPTTPPLKKAVRLTKKKHIGIMASKGTLESKEFNYLINKEIPQEIFVTKVNSSKIIELVENGAFLFEQKTAYKMIRDIIKVNFDDTVDVVVLCSTHLPFIDDYLQSILPSAKFVDSSVEVAKYVKGHLRYSADINKNNTGKCEILVSADKLHFQSILRYMGVKETIYDVSLQF